MPKVTDRAAYVRKLATDAGFTGEALEQVVKAFEHKAFTDGFMPVPDYSHDLDDVRNRTKTEVENGYKQWHENEVKKFEQNDRIWRETQDQLAKYKTTFGEIDLTNPNPPNPNGGKSMSPEEIKKLLDEQMSDVLARRDRATLDLMSIREDYMDRFKKRLNVTEFEKAWKDHPEWGMSMNIAYEKYIADDVKKLQESEFESRLKAKYDEGLRDGYSRKQLPADSSAKEFSPLFDRDTKVAEMSETDQERHSRESFMAGFTEKTPA